MFENPGCQSKHRLGGGGWSLGLGAVLGTEGSEVPNLWPWQAMVQGGLAELGAGGAGGCGLLEWDQEGPRMLQAAAPLPHCLYSAEGCLLFSPAHVSRVSSSPLLSGLS